MGKGPKTSDGGEKIEKTHTNDERGRNATKRRRLQSKCESLKNSSAQSEQRNKTNTE